MLLFTSFQQPLPLATKKIKTSNYLFPKNKNAIKRDKVLAC